MSINGGGVASGEGGPEFDLTVPVQLGVDSGSNSLLIASSPANVRAVEQLVADGRERIQQVLAEETDLLEYGDLFDGSHVMEGLTNDLAESAWAEMTEILDLGGAFEAIDEMKGRLVRSHAERIRRIESGAQTVVGVNKYTEAAESPLGGEDSIMKVDAGVQDELIADVEAWRSNRDADAVKRSLDELRRVAESGENVMPATIDLAHAGGTTGEWSELLRDVFGEYRAPTGVAAASGFGPTSDGLRGGAERIKARAGGPPRLLVAKPGLDGHSNGAEQIAVAARDAGFEVIYQGIRLTPKQIAAVAADEDVDAVGLSILSGSHLALIPETVGLLAELGVDVPVVAGGIIPEDDRQPLLDGGVAAVYTPKDFDLTKIMGEILDLIEG